MPRGREQQNRRKAIRVNATQQSASGDHAREKREVSDLSIGERRRAWAVLGSLAAVPVQYNLQQTQRGAKIHDDATQQALAEIEGWVQAGVPLQEAVATVVESIARSEGEAFLKRLLADRFPTAWLREQRIGKRRLSQWVRPEDLGELVRERFDELPAWTLQDYVSWVFGGARSLR